MHLLSVLLLLLIATGCKQSEMSGSNKRAGSRGTGQDGTGKNQRNGPDGSDGDLGNEFDDGSNDPGGGGKSGKGKSGGSDGSGDGSDDGGSIGSGSTGGSSGNDGKDNGSKDDGGSSDASSSGSKNPDIIDNGTVEIGEDDVGTDGGEITGKKAKLKLVGLRNDDGGVSIEITRADGKTRSGQWPGKGQTIEIDDVCYRSKTKIKVKVTFKGKTFNPSNQKCFVGKEADKKSLHVGFEEDCDSTDFNQIDDTIATWSCPYSDLTIESLRMDSSIDMTNWLK